MTQPVWSSTLFQGWIVAVGFLIILLVDVHRKAASAATGGKHSGMITGCGSLRRCQHSSHQLAQRMSGLIRQPAHVASIEALVSPYRESINFGANNLSQASKCSRKARICHIQPPTENIRSPTRLVLFLWLSVPQPSVRIRAVCLYL